MELSRVLSHVVKPNYEKEYLLFSRYEEPYIRIVNYDEYDNRKYFMFEVKGVNIRYLYYYLVSHMELFKIYSDFDFKMGHLTTEIICKTNIDNLTIVPGYLQDSLADFMDTFYVGEIKPFERKIKSLFYKNRKLLETLTDIAKGDIIKGIDLYHTIFDVKFVNNISNGKFKDPIEDYVELLCPELVYPRYLQYYWYYNDITSNEENYNFEDEDEDGDNSYILKEFHAGAIDIKLPPISVQYKIVEEMEHTHNKILLLRREKRSIERILKKITDALNPITN